MESTGAVVYTREYTKEVNLFKNIQSIYSNLSPNFYEFSVVWNSGLPYMVSNHFLGSGWFNLVNSFTIYSQ